MTNVCPPDSDTPLLGFAAFSGTGKTTLLTQLIPRLTALGLKIGTVKYSHHDFDIDKPGKDSFRLRKAGAHTVMIVSPYRSAVVREFAEPKRVLLSEQLRYCYPSEMDLILVEGFKQEPIPKIELFRPVLKKPLIYPSDESVIAVASDQPLILPAHLTLLDLNDIPMITDFILARFYPKARERPA